jgi:hypothetical protein
MTIENLIKAVPPPAAPFEPFQGRWGPIEIALGTPLPPDYKDFARLYGSGGFMDFVLIAVPGADGGVRFARWVGEICRDFTHMERESPTIYWPIPGGLLPLGHTTNGDNLFWQTRGPPETWRIAVWDRGGPFGENIEMFDCDLTDFLAGLATGAITPEAFPDDFFPYEPLFEPSHT